MKIELTKLYRDSKVKANKETLNAISMAFHYASMHEDKIGNDAVAEWYESVSNQIYEALKEVGFYD